jgi:hypothetical protein
VNERGFYIVPLWVNTFYIYNSSCVCVLRLRLEEEVVLKHRNGQLYGREREREKEHFQIEEISSSSGTLL